MIISRKNSRRLTTALADSRAQSLLEVALLLPVLVLLLGFAVDFGYFFLVAANLSSAARNAAEYSVQGYESVAQGRLPSAGPMGSVSSVAAAATSDLGSLVNASTITSVEVCSEANGVKSSLPVCTSYGPSTMSFVPASDPEPTHFTLQRVDVTYTVQPPVALKLFHISLLGSLQFHRQASMRALE